MQDQPNERIAGLEDRRTTLQIIIRLGREAQHGPLGKIERAEAHRVTWQAEQELEQIELELRRCPECGGPLEGWAGEQHSQQCSRVDELQRRADEIAAADRAQDENEGRS